MSDTDRIFDDRMGQVCETIQKSIDDTFLDRLTKGRAKSWLEDCAQKGRDAREQDGDGVAVFNAELVPLRKHIDFFGKNRPSQVA